MNRDPKDRNPPWWNRRTRLERTLCCITTVSMLMLLAMAVALAVLGYHNSLQSLGFGGDSTKVCLSPGCVNAASTLLQNMNQSVDPCENFYEFACGGWVHRHPIPEDRPSVSQFSLIWDQLKAQLRSLVEKPPQDSEPGFIHKMKHMYRSCLNTSLIDSYGEEPLQRVLRALGGWPVVEGPGWDASRFHWLDALIQYRNFGYSHNILLALFVVPDFRNNTRFIIFLDQASLGLPDRAYFLKGLNDSVVAAYLKLMTEAAGLLGADKMAAETELRDALQFETELANYSLPREERRNISKRYNKMPLNGLKRLAPQVWSVLKVTTHAA
ncbi:neprilysin-2-like [Ixodes scapularis]|uniref:neprilysin-2-like n=1 Tax=Ixodes scapularis TaxID=6945 RepID=UPI001C3878AC|nr:neprilysin-2-like [Ixodes scapularis]